MRSVRSLLSRNQFIEGVCHERILSTRRGTPVSTREAGVHARSLIGLRPALLAVAGDRLRWLGRQIYSGPPVAPATWQFLGTPSCRGTHGGWSPTAAPRGEASLPPVAPERRRFREAS